MNLRSTACLAFLMTGAVFASAGTILSQIGGPSTVSTSDVYLSNNFESANSTFSTGALDDFRTDDFGYVLKTIRAVVGLFPDTSAQRSFANVTSWRVEIYSGAAAAGNSLTGDVASRTLAPGAVTVNTSFIANNDKMALVTLPVDIVLARNTTYWLGVIADMPTGASGGFGPNGAVGVAAYTGNNAFPGGANAIQNNPGRGLIGDGWATIDPSTNLAYEIEAVPEPGTMLALGAGLAFLARRRRK